jgi:hypothetical protein
VSNTGKIMPLFGFGTGRKSANVSAQQRTNLYVEVMEDEEKGRLVLYARPGLVRQVIALRPGPPLGYTPVPGAIRGMIQVFNEGLRADVVYYAAGNVFYWMDGPLAQLAMPAATPSPTFLASTGPVRFAFNGDEVLAVDGVSAYLISGGVPFVTDSSGMLNPPPAGARTVCALGGFLVCDDPSASGRWRWSDINDASSWPSLNFATAELLPDTLTGVFAAHGELWLMGASSIEIWAVQPSGLTGSQPFTRIPGVAVEWGTTAYDTIRQVGGGGEVCFLGRNINGQRQVVMMQAYKASVVSTPDIDAEIAADLTPDAATAVVEIHSGHIWYVLNLASRSWAFDLTTSQKVGAPVWEIWSTDGGRYAGQYAVTAWNIQFQSDYRDQRIYQLGAGVYTDDGQTLAREVVTKHAVGDYERFTIDEIFVDLETGVGAETGGAPPGSALRFDGVSTYVNVPDVVAHQIAPPLTLEAMVTFHSAVPPLQGIVRKMDAGIPQVEWLLQAFNGRIRASYTGATGIKHETPEFLFTVGVPTRVSARIAPTVIELFINGVFFGLTPITGGTPAPVGEPLTIGCISPYALSPVPTEFAPATISDVRLWNILRTPEQILTLAFERLNGSEPGLLSYWKLDEGNGLVANDTMGVQNGALTSTTPASTMPQWVADPTWPNNTVATTPQIMAQWSKDGGHTWGSEIWQSLGAIGAYRVRAVWRMLGLGRDWLFRLRVTDAIKVVIINAAMRVRG